MSEKVRKILRSLPKQWEAKVTAIQEAKNLSILPLDELVGSLMTHEMTMKQNSDDSVKTDKEKNLTFSSSTSNSTDEKDVVLLARKFKKFLKHDRKNRRNFNKDSDERSKRSEKAMVATWDDSDSTESESENDEQANVCFMTIQDEVTYSKPNSLEFSFDELLDAFEELHSEFEILISKNEVLKNKNSSLSNELSALIKKLDNKEKCISCEKIQNKNELLKQKIKELDNTKIKCLEVDSLKEKILDYEKIIFKFTKGKKVFEQMLGEQVAIFDKCGLGFNTQNDLNHKPKNVLKANYNSKFVCNYCNQNGHLRHSCRVKKSVYFGGKTMKNTWILDSGCSRHMTGDIQQFSSLEKKVGGKVTFGDDAKGNILGKGTVGNSSSPLIENVLLVENLSYNLMSVSQLCDKGFRVVFESSKCFIMDSVSDEIIFVGKRFDNVFTIDINVAKDVEKCFVSFSNESWLWHRRLGHANMELLNKLSTKQLVKGLPSVTFQKYKLLHLDLFGPMRTASLGGKFYVFVIVDDFSRFTWTLFLTHKNEAFQAFSNLCKRIQNEKGILIVAIRSDHGKEFENKDFENYCLQNGFEHNFSAPRTPQQNGVVERKNRSI
ncbi:hypothetical protein UlMin_042895 [Ulmus minor]